MWCHGRRRIVGLSGPHLVGPQASLQEDDDYPAQESVAQWHGRYEMDEDDTGVSPKAVGAVTALCFSARPLSGVGSVTTP